MAPVHIPVDCAILELCAVVIKRLQAKFFGELRIARFQGGELPRKHAAFKLFATYEAQSGGERGRQFAHICVLEPTRWDAFASKVDEFVGN